MITYYSNGQKNYEKYYLNGNYHRKDGPAIQRWYENGKKKYEIYYLNGEVHNEDRPAYQSWDYNGQKQSEYYYLNGIKYSKKEWLIKTRKLKLIKING